LSAETYVLVAMDAIFYPLTRSSLLLAYPTHRPAAGSVAAGVEQGWCQVR
jgi:hypothetical protein